jgi:MFS family permease
MTNVGGIFGILLNTYSGDILGRKKAFMGTVFLTLLGTALSTGAVNYEMLGRRRTSTTRYVSTSSSRFAT